jgi:Protein kinase domain
VNPERWRQIERIYHVALERPPREREAFLKNECHGDEGLRLEVHSLLRRAASAENFLDEPAVEAAAQVMSQPEAPAMPEQIGRYRVTGKLGEGGMGLLYEAVDDRLGRPIALKVIRRDTVANSVARERFWREARLAASVNHPHICQIYEVGEADQQLFIAMERVCLSRDINSARGICSRSSNSCCLSRGLWEPPATPTIHARVLPSRCSNRLPILFELSFARHHTSSSLRASRQRSIFGR